MKFKLSLHLRLLTKPLALAISFTKLPLQAMYSNSELSWEKVEKLVDEIVFKVTGRHLNDNQAAVLEGAYEGKSYDEIGKDIGLTSGHVSKDVGSPLWKILSEGTQEDVSKTNFRQALKRYGEEQASSLNDASSPETTPIQRERANILESPEGQGKRI